MELLKFNYSSLILKEEKNKKIKYEFKQSRIKLTKDLLNAIKTDNRLNSELSDSSDYSQKALEKTNFTKQKGIVEMYKTKLKIILKNKPKIILKRAHRFTTTCVCITDDEKYFFSGSKDGSIIQWSLSCLKKIHTWYRDIKGKFGHAQEIISLAVNFKRTILVTGGKKNIVYVWDLTNFSLKHRIHRHSKDITCLHFQHGTNQFYSAGKDRVINVYDAYNASWKESLMGPTEAITCLHGLAKPTLVASGLDRAVRFFKIDNEKHLLFPNAHKSTIDSIVMLNYERWVTGSNDGNVKLWGTHKRKALYVLQKPHNGKWIISLETSPFTDIFISGSSNGNIKFHQVNKRDQIQTLGQVKIFGFINSLSLSKTSHYLIIAVGKTHRLGSWEVLRYAKNGVVIIKLSRKIINLFESKIKKLKKL